MCLQTNFPYSVFLHVKWKPEKFCWFTIHPFNTNFLDTLLEIKKEMGKYHISLLFHSVVNRERTLCQYKVGCCFTSYLWLAGWMCGHGLHNVVGCCFYVCRSMASFRERNFQGYKSQRDFFGIQPSIYFNVWNVYLLQWNN